jgi:hypothetical protein
MIASPTCGRLAIVALAAFVAARPALPQDAFSALEEQGLEVAAGGRVKLPAGVVRFDVAQSAADLRELAGAADWDRFTADGLTAPVTVAIEPAAVDGVRLGHRVKAAFTLRAPLERLRSDDSLRRSLATGDDAKGGTFRPLTAAERTAAGLPGEADGPEQLVRIEVPLLNRVVIRGVVRAVRREHPDGVEVAWGFEPRLADDAAWRPTWSRLEANDLGSRVEGPPQPYGGCGGIVAVRRLAAESGVELLVVESRMVLAEPEAWFQGSNQLRSKIALATQEGVRSLRRRLAAAR